MEQHDETKGSDYPRGRGYGHDYMRGGEVFGGYGYSQRDGYQRPRGEPHEDGGSRKSAADHLPPVSASTERFPQDERAGGWEIPHDLETVPAGAGPGFNGAPSGVDADGAAPVPQIEHTFGDTGGNREHSRSYYVTQAQLQYRLYASKGKRRPEVEDPDR